MSYLSLLCGEERDVDVAGAVPRHGLVDGVVDDLPDKVVEPRTDPVGPMYIPGTCARTGSSPSRTVMSLAS